eukprot:53101-Prymnesium_polylepis.2
MHCSTYCFTYSPKPPRLSAFRSEHVHRTGHGPWEGPVCTLSRTVHTCSAEGLYGGIGARATGTGSNTGIGYGNSATGSHARAASWPLMGVAWMQPIADVPLSCRNREIVAWGCSMGFAAGRHEVRKGCSTASQRGPRARKTLPAP